MIVLMYIDWTNVLYRDSIITMYRGMEAKILQTVLTSALMFVTYEHIISVVFLLLGQQPQ